MDNLSTAMSNLSTSTKRSFVQAFLDEEALKSTASKDSTRIALTKAKNKRDKICSNMRKTKQRMQAILETKFGLFYSHQSEAK